MKLTKEIIEKLIHEETLIFKYGFAITSPIEYCYKERFFNADKTQSFPQTRQATTALYGTKHTLRTALIHGVVMIDDAIMGYQTNDDLESPAFNALTEYQLSEEEAKDDYLEGIDYQSSVIELPNEHAFIALSAFFPQNTEENVSKVVAEMNKRGIVANIIRVPKKESE